MKSHSSSLEDDQAASAYEKIVGERKPKPAPVRPSGPGFVVREARARRAAAGARVRGAAAGPVAYYEEEPVAEANRRRGAPAPRRPLPPSLPSSTRRPSRSRPRPRPRPSRPRSPAPSRPSSPIRRRRQRPRRRRLRRAPWRRRPRRTAPPRPARVRPCPADAHPSPAYRPGPPRAPGAQPSAPMAAAHPGQPGKPPSDPARCARRRPRPSSSRVRSCRSAA